MAVFMMVCMSLISAASFKTSLRYSSGNGPRMPPLKLRIQVTNGVYCRGDNDTGVLQIQCRLVYTNLGKQRLILYEESGAIERIMIAKNEEDFASGRFFSDIDWVTRADRVTAGKPIRAVKISESHGPRACGFTILDPGHSLTTKQLFLLPYRRAGSKVRHFLGPGRYRVQVETETWPDYALVLSVRGEASEPSDVRKVLSDRWENWGDLWFQPSVTSEPFWVSIEDNPGVESCK